MASTNTPQPAPAAGNDYSIEYYKSQMSVLLEREKELQETQRHLQRVVTTLMSLQKISRFLKTTATLDEGLDYVLKALVTETNYERAVIMLTLGSTPRVATQGYSQDEQAALRGVTKTALDEFLLDVQKNQDSVFLLQPAESKFGQSLLPLLKFDTCLLALISDKQGVIGFIAAGYSPAQAAYFAPILGLKQDDTVWFDELAHQISSTIINLGLLDNLKAEQARLSASINSLVLGFMIVDTSHKVVFSNQALNSILGVDHIASMKDVANRFAGLDVVKTGDQAVAQKTPIEIKEVLYDKKILRLFFGPITKDASVIGYIFLVEDITEAKSIERSREEFFSIASHELRTPLTAIRGNSSMLLRYYAEKFLDADSKEMISDIESSAERLIKIVNDFLQVSRLEQKKLTFDVRPLDVGAMLSQAVTELKPIADAKKLQLIYQPPTGPVNVEADPDRLKEVITNLISNGLNYTHEGHVEVSVEQKADGVTVRFHDTGVGIPPRNQSLLFRKFQQAGDPLTRDNSQSTGLGLYICKLMVEAMKGTIQLEASTPGQGSTFSFTLPAAH